MNRRAKFNIAYLLGFLILSSTLAPDLEVLRQSYELRDVVILDSSGDFYSEYHFFADNPAYNEFQVRFQTFRYVIFMTLAVLLLISGSPVVFSYSFPFVYLIQRFNKSVIAFFLGGRAPPYAC